MSEGRVYPLSLNGDTFNALKTDFDQMLKNLIREMTNRESEDATINIKIGVQLEPGEARDYEANGYDATREITKPRFKHEISTVMQVKNKKSGTVGGNFELCWDRELGQYVMRDIDNGQISMFASEKDVNSQKDAEEAEVIEDPQLPASTVERRALPEGKIIEADFVDADRKTPFDYMMQYVGMEMRVCEAAQIYTVRTVADNRVVLSSAFREDDPFYCSGETLEKHVGCKLLCDGVPHESDVETILIVCSDCEKILFQTEREDIGSDYPYEEPEEG